MQPVVERPSFFSPQGDVTSWANSATQLLQATFQQYGYRLNRVAPLDGSEPLTLLDVNGDGDISGNLVVHGTITASGGITYPSILDSVLATNGSGVVAGVATATNDRLLRRTSGAYNFGQLTAGMFPNAVVPDAALSANVALYNGTTAFTAMQTINVSGEGLRIKGTTTGDANIAYVTFHTSAAVRIGYVGDASSGNSDIYLVAEQSGGSLQLFAGGSLRAKVTSDGNFNAEGQIRAKGWYASGTGIAAEMGVSSSEGFFLAYDRTNSVYKNVTLGGLGLTLATNGASRLVIDSSGQGSINSSPVGGVALRISTVSQNAGLEIYSNSTPSVGMLAYDRTAGAYRLLAIACDTVQWSLVSAEMRLVYDAAFLSFYNTANNSRTGYLQMVTGGDSTLANEVSGHYINLAHASGGAVNVGTQSSTSGFKTGGRGTLGVGGATDAIIELIIGSTVYGYMYVATSEFRLTAYQNIPMTFYTNATLRATISAAGAWRWHAYGAGTLTTDASGNITAVSDSRYKKNMRPFTRGLDAIEKLNPKYYYWNEQSGMDTTHEYAGWIAQDVQQAIPEAVSEQPNGMLGIQERPIQATIVNALQEISKRLKKLEAHS